MGAAKATRPRADADMLDAVQACELLGVSEAVLRDAMRRQGLPYRRVGAKVLRFSRAALVGWVAAGTAADDLSDDGMGSDVGSGSRYQGRRRLGQTDDAAPRQFKTRA